MRVVLGAGPVGLVAALAVARTGRRVVLVTERVPALDSGWPPTVEAAPLGFSTLLAELGAAAAVVDAATTVRRVVAWESATPQLIDAPPALHLERPRLEQALLALVLATPAVRLVIGGHGSAAIDATGRRSVTARVRHRPPRPWHARLFSFPRSGALGPELALAAQPDGYAYRLGSRRTIVLGVVGPRPPATFEQIVRRLAEHGALWLVEGLPVDRARPCPPRVASAQWTDDAGPIRVGDAALARDALSSQGLATGASEALYAAAADSPSAVALLRARQHEQRALHLAGLGDQIARCRYAEAPAWAGYRRWLESVRLPGPALPRVALRQGRIALSTDVNPLPPGALP